MTFSFWSKHDGTYNIDGVFTSGTASFYDSIVFDGDTCATAIANSGATGLGAVLYPAARLRDPSAWLHYVMVLDTPNATAGDRLRIYINGERVTAFASSPVAADPDPGQNYDTKYWNTTATHRLGSAAFSGSPDRFFSGYLAEVHCVFGSALDPTDFGEFDDNGVWRPIAYTGSYGTNGFYLKFDPTATNGIGHDHSGNGNNFSPTGFSTSGTGTDVMSDTPTTNWCTLNPLTTSGGTYKEGNLQVFGAAPDGTFLLKNGKWYFEATQQTASYTPRGPGSMWTLIGFRSSNLVAGLSGASGLYDNGYFIDRAVSTTNADLLGGNLAAGQVIGVALDIDANTYQFFVNNSSVKTGTLSATAGVGVFPLFYSADPSYAQYVINFGQRAFAYTPPTGYKALNTANLPEPDIKDGSQYFDTKLYTANNQTAQTITGLGFSPDLLWFKPRSRAEHHYLYDQVRGAGNRISSSQTIAEVTGDNSLTAFTSDGFSLGVDGAGIVNYGTDSMVAWAWDAGGTGSSNTDGSITSTVSANPTAGFSIVTWNGSTANGTVGHGLGVAPSLIIFKRRNAVTSWPVYHSAISPSNVLYLNEGAAQASSGNSFGSTPTAPTSTVFSVGDKGDTNYGDMLSYCFSEVAGYSKFGKYTGNGSTDGSFVYCGFRPAVVLTKCSSNAGDDWRIWDNQRPGYNLTNLSLAPNTSAAEDTSTNNYAIDILSNGFKLRSSTTGTNGSGRTYIFMALAENPFGGSGVSPATAR